jgi:hypothetical protein
MMFKAMVAVTIALAAYTAEAQQIIKCVGKDGKTYVGSTLPPQCTGQAVSQMNKEGQVVKRTEAMLTPEQRAAKDAEQRIIKEKEAEAQRKEKEEVRKNNALLSTYASEKDIDIARARALADNEKAVKETQAKIVQIEKQGITVRKELEFYTKGKPPAKVTQDIQNNDIDLKAQQNLLAAKLKDVDVINTKYDEDRRRYIELTKGPSTTTAVAVPTSAAKPAAKK